MLSPKVRSDPARGHPVFQDRRDAGRQLAARLAGYASVQPIVVAMPRGGVPVAAAVADALGAPLDILCVRKLGVPWQPELGIGAIAEGGIRVLNDALIHDAGVRTADVEQVTVEETSELARRIRRYRGDHPALPVMGRTVILVDDGLATGYTARAAIQALRVAGAERVVLAIPVAPRESAATMADVADDVVVVETPGSFAGVGQAYRDFTPTTDQEVLDGLDRARADRAGMSAPARQSGG
jgi:putative phosphoribosyl transferase